MAMAINSTTTKQMLRRTNGCVAGLVIALLAVTGCQPKSEPIAVKLPPPSFDGPNILNSPASPKAQGMASAGPSGPASWAPKAAPRAWKWVVVHHSATPAGSSAMFDKEHKAKGWDGVGYHFVIGNGTGTPDGQVEVTARWPQQKWGAHAKTADNRFNEHGIGICLVGNFDVERPTPKQIASLTQLTSYLMQQYRIAPQNVVGHRDTKATECPGRYVNLASIRQRAAGTVAAAGGDAEPDVVQTAAGVELLGDVQR